MEDTLELIRKNAEMVVVQMQAVVDFPFGYTPDSVAFIDGFIERQRVHPDITPEAIDKLVNTLGSFLGQTIIFCYGGDWCQDNDTWAVAFDDKNKVYPFTKVGKQFANGEDDSIDSFFSAIPVVFKDKISNLPQP